MTESIGSSDIKPIKTVEVGDNTFYVVVLTRSQVDRIAESVVTKLLEGGLDHGPYQRRGIGHR